MVAKQHSNIPILTDVIAADRGQDEAISAIEADGLLEGAAPESGRPPPDVENLIAELQTRLASATFALTEELMRAAFAEMEAKIYQQISARLRRDLPELIDALLREHLDADRDP